MKLGQWPDLPRMNETIKDAGFVPGGTVELVVTGTLLKQENGLVIALDGMNSPVSLPVHSEPKGSVKSADLEQRVGEMVELEGRWQPVPADQSVIGELSVTAIRSALERQDGQGSQRG